MARDPGDPPEIRKRLQSAAAGDSAGWEDVLAPHRDRLRRIVAFRMDPQLRSRVDPSDVLQEVYLEAFQHLGEYLRQTDVPFFVWLRAVAGNKLLELHRYHLGTRMRDAGREVSIDRGGPAATSAALAAQLLGHATAPSEAAIRAEAKILLQEALNAMDPIDREVLALRHFEHLTPAESARVLGIKEKAAGMRYLRALKRLKEILTSLPGGPVEF
jgi:RNA polymerase sigma-70 factor (ECF subfamily)